MIQAQPLISVILPTRNRARLLARAIRSVLAQTYRNLELIVVDDASTDNTAEIVASFPDARVRYLRLEENRRAAAARNFGLEAARGDLISYLDDDDFFLLDKLTKQVAMMTAAPADVGVNICAHITLTQAGARYLGGPQEFAKLDFARGFNWQFGLIATPGWLVRRGLLEQVGGFDERMRCWDDWELGLRLAAVCRFEHLDEPLFVQDWRRLSAGMWDNRANHANDLRLILEKHGHMWRGDRTIQSRHCTLLGRSELSHHSVPTGREWLRKAVSADPRNMQAWVYIFASYFGRSAVRMMENRPRIIPGPRRRRGGTI